MEKTKFFFAERAGRMEQFAGAQRGILTDGKASGVEVVDMWNYAGLCVQVLPGRGMDIGRVSFKGVPYSYLAKPGIVSPAYYENGGMYWLRNFFAGMLTTCGLSNVGSPDSYEDPVIGEVGLGLHGRISNAASENVSIKKYWENDEYKIEASGEVREACLHAENFVLKRKVSLSLYGQSLKIEDTIVNESFIDLPLMLLYHVNIGYPVLDQGSVIHVSESRTRAAQSYENDDWQSGELPQKGYRERLYFHEPKKDSRASAGIVNPKKNLGFELLFCPDQLPYLTEWKMFNCSEYVLGLEPGNCLPIGRSANRQQKLLEILPAYAEKNVSLEMRFYNTAEEIEDFIKRTERVGKQ